MLSPGMELSYPRPPQSLKHSPARKIGSGQPALADVYRIMEDLFDKSGRYLDSIKSHFDQQEKKLDGFMEKVD